MLRQVAFWMIFPLFVVLVSTPSAADEKPKKSRLYNALGYALVGTAASDLVSTELALREPGTREANPLMATNTETRVAVKASVTALVFLASNHAHAKGHDKAALWLRIAVVAGYGYVTAHNLRHVR